MSTTAETLKPVTLPDLSREQCIALTTFRRTGQPVTTTVWFAVSGDLIYVETHADAGKLKRLRHTARVTFAPCTYSGKTTGSEITGNARIPTEPEMCSAAALALRKKYGVMLAIFHFMRTLRCMLQRKAKVGSVYIAIAPTVS